MKMISFAIPIFMPVADKAAVRLVPALNSSVKKSGQCHAGQHWAFELLRLFAVL